jgi:hypothetical protein
MRYSFAVWLALCPSVVWGATFGIDFDRGVTASTQPGFASSLGGLTPLTGGNDTSSFSNDNTYPNAFGPGKDFRYIFSGSRRLHRGTITGGPFVDKSALLSGFWGTRGSFTSGTPISFSIELFAPSGDYRLTTYHHDVVSDAPSGNTFTLEITDATGPHDPLAVVESFGDAPLAIGMVTTTITSDGDDGIFLKFNPARFSTEFGINGFLLEEILATPEPAGLITWLIAGAVVCGLVARKRRLRKG